MNTWSLITSTGVLVVLAISAPAIASRGDAAGGLAALRHDLAEPVRRGLVELQGRLSCDLGSENSGRGCELKLRDTQSGRLYRLIEARAAMQLYLDGAQNVIIEGSLADSETIQVRSARTL